MTEHGDGRLAGGREIGEPRCLVGEFDAENPLRCLVLPREPGQGRAGEVHADAD